MPRPLLVGGLPRDAKPKVERAQWRDWGANAVCSLGCYTQRASGCAAQSVSAHLHSTT